MTIGDECRRAEQACEEIDAGDSAFPNGQSALVLMADRLLHVAGANWGATPYMNTAILPELTREKAGTQLAQAAVP